MTTDGVIVKHKTWAEIDLSALRRNYRAVDAYTGNSAVMCVVKADAYGHGAAECAGALYDEGARWFAVSCIEEAEELYGALYGRDGVKILILGYTPPENAPLLSARGFRQTVFSPEYAAALSAAAESAGVTVTVHYKLDTGMNRIGFDAGKNAADEILCAASMKGLLSEGLFTHFACADSGDGSITEAQYGKYKATEEILSANGLHLLRHVCNSAATVLRRDLHLDMVRAGIILYGLDPWIPYDGELPLCPVMRFKSTISHIHTVRAGESVSYGWTYTASRDTRVATVPVGYADGFIRAFGDGGCVYINGEPAPIIGRVCMDQCMADISRLENVSVGDEVTIFGDEPEKINRLAEVARTINYELVCLIGKRVARIYKYDD